MTEELPTRVITALAGKTAISLQVNSVIARARQRDDIDRLLDLGMEPHMKISTSQHRIRMASGGQILYLFGDQRWLEQGLRGMRADYLENAHLVDPNVVHWVTHT